MNFFSKLSVFMVGICLLGVPACRSSKWQSPDDLAALQAERRDHVAKSVGLKRSEAEMQLARDAWGFGDRTACLSALDNILEREPGHVDALLLKAEVHLAKDELIDADRSIAIALSHDPSNATAKRLSEITRTKELASRPMEEQESRTELAESAPLPGGAVAQATYSPSSPGIAVAGDQQLVLPNVERAEYTPPLATLSEPAAASPVAQALQPAIEPQELEPSIDKPASLATDNAAPPVPEEYEAAEDEIADSSSTGSATEGQETSTEPTGASASPASSTPWTDGGASEAVAESPKPANSEPLPLPPEDAVEVEVSDLQTGMAEVSDLPVSSSQVEPVASAENQNSKSPFLSALQARDSVAALGALEEELVATPDDPQIAISATVAALEANQPETAASIARLGIAFHPSCAGLHRTLGAALYRTGKYASSQVALQQALSLDNSSALSYFLMGCVSEKLGDAEAAQSHFARAAELDPSLAASK